MKRLSAFIGMFLILVMISYSQVPQKQTEKIIPGGEQSDVYLPLLKGKSVGLVINHTAMAGNQHLLDFLTGKKINVVTVFAPEHGYRGEAADGDIIRDGRDEKTGVQVVSLYGENRKPTPEQLKQTDVMVYDIQDVGCRFYTFLSTLYYVIEACAENDIPLIVLDRPNPNGDYVAGPVLKPEFTSFVGIIPVPIVHGCTLGEMALMINGEKWHKAPKSCNLQVITVKNYTHSTPYEPPRRPSPNLPNYQSIRLYPSLCLFEATSISIGRGTEFPFQVAGGTDPSLGSFQFTPRSIPGISDNPANKGKTCYGIDLRTLSPVPPFTLKYIIDFYKKFPDEKAFLNSERGFNLRAGTDGIIKGFREGKNEEEIINGWLPELNKYKEIRKKYLLYPDFE
jgi:uncharacterized protein YbbC (DUF1343 family)